MSTTPAWAEEVASEQSVQVLIEQARTASLAGDRITANQILIEGLGRRGLRTPLESSSMPFFDEEENRALLRTLHWSSRLFFTDRAQQSYEVALNAVLMRERGAGERVSEALRLEPENLGILLLAARRSLMVDDCSGARGQLEKIEGLNPFDRDVLLLRAQVLRCSEEWEALGEWLSLVRLELLEKDPVWQGLKLDYFLESPEPSIPELGAKDWAKHFPRRYPESHYWLYRYHSWWHQQEIIQAQAEDTLSGSEGEEAEAEGTPLSEFLRRAQTSAQQYATECRQISARTRREFISDPHLCQRLSEVENFLKKLAD